MSTGQSCGSTKVRVGPLRRCIRLPVSPVQEAMRHRRQVQGLRLADQGLLDLPGRGEGLLPVLLAFQSTCAPEDLGACAGPSLPPSQEGRWERRKICDMVTWRRAGRTMSVDSRRPRFLTRICRSPPRKSTLVLSSPEGREGGRGRGSIVGIPSRIVAGFPPAIPFMSHALTWIHNDRGAPDEPSEPPDPSGVPPDREAGTDNFKLVEQPIPELADGQVLVRNHYLSLDPTCAAA